MTFFQPFFNYLFSTINEIIQMYSCIWPFWLNIMVLMFIYIVVYVCPCWVVFRECARMCLFFVLLVDILVVSSCWLFMNKATINTPPPKKEMKCTILKYLWTMNATKFSHTFVKILIVPIIESYSLCYYNIMTWIQTAWRCNSLSLNK